MGGGTPERALAAAHLPITLCHDVATPLVPLRCRVADRRFRPVPSTQESKHTATPSHLAMRCYKLNV